LHFARVFVEGRCIIVASILLNAIHDVSRKWQFEGSDLHSSRE